MVYASRPRFITVEGGEGVGKSSFISKLSTALKAQGVKNVTTREPGGTAIADRIRDIFVDPPADEPLLPATELCLVSAARCQHLFHVIKDQLANDVWVLCDRFADSTRVYQGELGNIDSNFIETLIQFTTGGLEPDLTFVLDCAVEVSIQRLSSRSASEGTTASRYDQAAQTVHAKIRNAFAGLQARFPSRICLIDAEASPEGMVAQAMREVEKRFSV